MQFSAFEDADESASVDDEPDEATEFSNEKEFSSSNNKISKKKKKKKSKGKSTAPEEAEEVDEIDILLSQDLYECNIAFNGFLCF